MKQINVDIGLKIRVLRDKKGWSMDELGIEVGISQSQVSLYELGKTNFNAEMLTRFGAVFGVPATYFLEKEPQNPEERTLSKVEQRLAQAQRELDQERTELEAAKAEAAHWKDVFTRLSVKYHGLDKKDD